MKRLLLMLLALLVWGVACAPAESGPQRLTLELGEFEFTPANLETDAGRQVELRIVNKGTLDHDFSVAEIPLTGAVETVEDHADGEGDHGHEMTVDMSELDLHVLVPAGEERTIRFTPAEAGSYGFTCSVPGHHDAGMEGMLEVAAP